MKRITLLFTLSLFINGVFGDEVSVMDGDSVTLHTNTVIEAFNGVSIIWKFGAQKTKIAQINKANNNNTVSIRDDALDGKFRGRLQLNDQTGDLTITNIRTTDFGMFEVDIDVGSEETQKSFDVKEGVVGAGGVKSVSVMEGDSVTLYTDDPDMQKYDVIRWRFQHKNSPIAEINRTAGIFSTYDNVLDGIFRDKLQLDIQTGFLDIRNIRTKHSGLYQVDIISTRSNYTIHQSFNVTISDTVKPVSVIVGDPVTLQTHLTELQKDDLIKWWFVHDDSLIAQIYKLNKLSRTYDGEEGKFSNRLKLNNQIGDLTIIDTKTEHTGLYEVKMSDRRRSIQRRFSVHVSERVLSPVVKAGIPVIILLLAAAAAAAAGVVIYYHRKDKRQEVDEGKSVHLKTEVKDIQRDEKIEWRFIPGEPTSQILQMLIAAMKRVLGFFRLIATLIAEINPANNIFSTYDGDDDLFRDKLNLNHQTGDLTINDIREEHTGVYILKIIRGGKTTEKRFIVFVRGERKTVEVDEGESADLNSKVTDVKKVDLMEWTFEETLIAKINPANKIFSTFDGDDDLFKDKLTLNHQTGDLNINNIRWKHNGFYTLKIIRDGKTSDRRFNVLVKYAIKERQVDEGEPVELKTDVKDTQRVDVIEWRFGDKETLIAEINPSCNIFRTYDGDKGLFRDKLNLDHQTGDLNISDIRWEHYGFYKLRIIRDGETSDRRFMLFVRRNKEELQVYEGEPVDLQTEVTDIKTGDLIEWTFGKTLIAEINPANNIPRTYDGDDDLFRDKLKLIPQTGDLNINDIRQKHTGNYTLKIIRDGKTSYKRINVFVRGNVERLLVYEEESVDLKTEVTDIKRVEKIEWRFRETLIAQIIPANNISSTYDGDDDLFKGKLNLNHRTGDLNINDIREKHVGEYKLKIIRGGQTSDKRFMLFVRSKINTLEVNERESVHLKTEVTDIKTVEKIEWRFGDKQTLIAEINPANNIFSTYDGDDGLFRDKLKLNHQTGNLNINDIRQKQFGDYHLRIYRDKKSLLKRFKVIVKGEDSGRKRGGDSVETRREDSGDTEMQTLLPNSSDLPPV